MEVKEVNGEFKIWIWKDWCYLSELTKEGYSDLVFNTRELAENRIKQIKDHDAVVTDEDWEKYCEKWNIHYE